MKKRNKKGYIAIFIIILIIIIFACYYFINDGKKNEFGLNIYYTNNKYQLLFLKKNGQTLGNLKNPIKYLKIKASKKNSIVFKVNKNNKWTNDIEKSIKLKNGFTGIRLEIQGDNYNKYDVCYRTYNSHDKWLGWSCNGISNGNSNYVIKGLELKIIPKDVVKNEYLKNYNMRDKTMIKID